MRRKAALLAVFLILGCGSRNAVDNPSVDNAPQSEPKNEGGVPAPANTAALRWIGFPFDKPVYYRMEGFQDRTFDGGREYKITPGGDKVTIDVIWTGDISSALGQSAEQWIAGASGIRSAKIQGNDIKPSPIFMPADPKKGSTWNESYSFEGINNQGKISIKSKSTILGTESVKVPAGTYQALVLKESGTMSTSTTSASIDGKTWFVEGLGMVKAVQNITRTPKGEEPSKVTITITAIPKPKE